MTLFSVLKREFRALKNKQLEHWSARKRSIFLQLRFGGNICIFIFYCFIHYVTFTVDKLYYNVCVLAAQSCLTLCDPTDRSLTGSSVHGILQVRILEWVAMPSSRDFPDPGI